MNQDKNKTLRRPHRIRTGSIARRINTAQAFRRFGRSFLLILLTVVLVAAGWCAMIEWAYGGEITNVANRRFGGSFNWRRNLANIRAEEGIWNELKSYIRENDPFDFNPSLPFDGIAYRFEVTLPSEIYDGTTPETEAVETTMPPVIAEETAVIPQTEEPVVLETEVIEETEVIPQDTETSAYTEILPEEPVVITKKTLPVSHDAAGMLTVCALIFGIAFLFELLVLLSCLMSGSRIIKKYLKPLDEIAVLAERLSAESRSLTREQARQRGADELDLGSLENAINAIEDSDTRLQVHDAELGSLEAALNNMLKRLDEAKRKQIRFVDDASHELRTPIAVIQGYVQLLDRWGKEDPKIRDEAIEAIKTEAEHMKTLIDQLLFLARGEMDRHVLEKEPLNICAVLEEIRDESIMLDENAAVHHEFSLSLPMQENPEDEEFPYETMYIHADPAMMKQAIRILRDNAVKYTPEGGRITFKAYQRTVAGTAGEGKQSVCIEISDTGIGIKSKELPRIFDRFYRGENVRANNSSGSGLGLSIAKWIIDEHGGIVEAISSEGFGTRMTIVMDEWEYNAAEIAG